MAKGKTKVKFTAPPPAAPIVADEVWIMRDGRRILVGDMDHEHCQNALRMILRASRHARKLRALASRLKMLRELADEIEGEEHKWGKD